MWIVRVALDRPYTFIVLALDDSHPERGRDCSNPNGHLSEHRHPCNRRRLDVYRTQPRGVGRSANQCLRAGLTTTVDNIRHLESTTVNGQAIVKVFLKPGASLDTANAQITAVSQFILRQLPPGTLPPLVIDYSASSVPILQLGLSEKSLSEQQLNDLGQNFLRTQLVTVPGAVVPNPYGGKQRQVMINLVPQLMQAKGVSPTECSTRSPTRTSPSG
jgi:AcrB/AcrD/AcrF family